MRASYLTSRLQGFGETIFAEMSALALRTGAINLGQGFPDVDGPAEVAEAAVAAIRAGHNQYPPGIGIRELRHAISVHQRRFWDLDYDPDLEVLVTAGATEALAASLLALCEVGDEVLTFEPTYDSYAACAAMAGATLRVVTLRPPDYSFDIADLRAAVTPKTRLLLLNSPHNPTGKVFSRRELDAIARVCLAHDLIAVTDEVYEHLVFDGEHVPLASLPGMQERTVTISSGGKTFSFTGWKVGWACSSPLLIEAVRTAKQFLTYASGGPFQHGIAAGLDLPNGYYSAIARELREKRDRFCDGLADAGFKVFPPAGTYFVTADIRPFTDQDGLAFCRELPARCGVVAVPNVVFYTNRDEGRHLVRFAFCKRREVLDEAIRRLNGIAA
jgi:N-succinyldiaminopimelate aminotransferase